MRLKSNLRRALITLVVLGVGVQFVPYGRNHAAPPVLGEPTWDSARTRELARRACFDCHSSETRWPWYTHVAPVSWLVQHDVDEGRAVLDFTAWTRPSEEASESAESVLEGEMPPRPYLWLHPSARLDAADQDALVQGLTRTFGSEATGRDGEGDGEGDGEDEQDG
ncbi:MAG: heme-binding domain-containing protein [Planctomycetes bacterium]|nr:heme-binding domain-containing protein [Planctomycetota bacterium]